MSGAAGISGVAVINEALVTISLHGRPSSDKTGKVPTRLFTSANRVARSNEWRDASGTLFSSSQTLSSRADSIVIYRYKILGRRQETSVRPR